MFIIFFLHIQEWWNIYELRLNEIWRLPTFLFVSLYPINLFILAKLLFPLYNHEEVVIDYKVFYFENYRKFFVALIASAFLSGLENYVLANSGLEGIVLQLIIMVVLSAVALQKIEKEWVHQFIVLLWVLAVIISIAVNWNDWLIT